MGKFDDYIEQARDFLKKPDAEVREAGSVVRVVGGVRDEPNFMHKTVSVYGRPEIVFTVKEGNLVCDYAVIFGGKLPIRSHEETDYEVIRNIGNSSIVYRHVGESWRNKKCDDELNEKTVRSGESIASVNRREGFYHGFRVLRGGDVGLFYVVKSLDPAFRDGSHFRMPKNTYRGKQF